MSSARDVSRYPGLPQARRVHQDVESTEVLGGLLHRRRNCVGVAGIALQPGGHQAIRRRCLVIRGDDLGARLGENPDGGRTDTGSGAGHQDPSALQWRRHIRHGRNAIKPSSGRWAPNQRGVRSPGAERSNMQGRHRQAGQGRRLSSGLCGTAIAFALAAGFATPRPHPSGPTTGGAMPVVPVGGGACIVGLNCGCIPRSPALYPAPPSGSRQ